MFKLVIVFVGILWASLVLISWGSDATPDQVATPVVQTQTSPLERSDR
jgi:hypothetical protein